jgi:hypothetical protein
MIYYVRLLLIGQQSMLFKKCIYYFENYLNDYKTFVFGGSGV